MNFSVSVSGEILYIDCSLPVDCSSLCRSDCAVEWANGGPQGAPVAPIRRRPTTTAAPVGHGGPAAQTVGAGFADRLDGNGHREEGGRVIDGADADEEEPRGGQAAAQRGGSGRVATQAVPEDGERLGGQLREALPAQLDGAPEASRFA